MQVSGTALQQASSWLTFVLPGAILVLFLFVLMLLNIGLEERPASRRP